MKNSPKFRRILPIQFSLLVLAFVVLSWPVHVKTIEELLDDAVIESVTPDGSGPNESCDQNNFQFGQELPLECGNRITKVI